MDVHANHHLEIGALPDLRVIHLRDLVFHEEPDPHRLANMTSRLRTEGVLKNPPIVASGADGGPFILLDGANRVSALLAWGFEHMLVQVVALDDPLLDLQTWHHAVERFDEEFFAEKIKALLGTHNCREVRPPIDDEARAGAIAATTAVCTLTFADGSSLAVHSDDGLLGRVRALKKVTGYYLTTPLFDRVSYTNLEHLKRNYPEFATLIRFHAFTVEELTQIVNTEERLPAGVTRVFLPKRALGLNIALDFLRSIATVEEKNRRLQAMILAKVRDKSIRFYREPTFVFDE